MIDFLSGENLTMMGQVLLAALLGAVIGTERELSRKPAGIRTYALVSMGSCLFTVISIFAADMARVILDDPSAFSDVGRIAAQVVVGIGFIGAGLAISHGSKVRGITTAAGVWVAAAVGMAVGFRMYAAAVFTALLALLIFVLLWQVEVRLVKKYASEPPSEMDV